MIPLLLCTKRCLFFWMSDLNSSWLTLWFAIHRNILFVIKWKSKKIKNNSEAFWPFGVYIAKKKGQDNYKIINSDSLSFTSKDHQGFCTEVIFIFVLLTSITRFLKLIQCIRKHEIKPLVLKRTRVRGEVSPEPQWQQMKWRGKDNQLQQGPEIRGLSQSQKKRLNLADFQS